MVDSTGFWWMAKSADIDSFAPPPNPCKESPSQGPQPAKTLRSTAKMLRSTAKTPQRPQRHRKDCKDAAKTPQRHRKDASEHRKDAPNHRKDAAQRCRTAKTPQRHRKDRFLDTSAIAFFIRQDFQISKFPPAGLISPPINRDDRCAPDEKKS